MIYPKYFLQTLNWANFWKEANPNNHQFFEIELKDKTGLVFDKLIVYEYPWYFKEKFWYVPRAFFSEVFKKTDSNGSDDLVFFSNFQKLLDQAKKKGICFLKIDLDSNQTKKYSWQSNQDFLNFIKTRLSVKTELSSRHIQFLQTMTLDLNQIKENKTFTIQPVLKATELQSIFNADLAFWKKTNQNIRRYTKKSFEKNWKVRTEKSPKVFKDFFLLYNQTKDRQRFYIQPKDYLEKLFKNTSSRIMVLYNQLDQPQAGWFGLISEDTLTYLYGGNSLESFKNYGQYYLHFLAINLAKQEKLKFYDLGGYNPDLGFGKFKEGYRGDIRIFLGAFDIPLKSVKFTLIKNCLKAVKLLTFRK